MSQGSAPKYQPTNDRLWLLCDVMRSGNTAACEYWPGAIHTDQWCVIRGARPPSILPQCGDRPEANMAWVEITLRPVIRRRSYVGSDCAVKYARAPRIHAGRMVDDDDGP